MARALMMTAQVALTTTVQKVVTAKQEMRAMLTPSVLTPETISFAKQRGKMATAQEIAHLMATALAPASQFAEITSAGKPAQPAMDYAMDTSVKTASSSPVFPFTSPTVETTLLKAMKSATMETQSPVTVAILSVAKSRSAPLTIWNAATLHFSGATPDFGKWSKIVQMQVKSV